ncbi:MAG: ATP-binding cassette domain-containing protein [Geminicoccaceae bacterium]|nr:MAG: ATP-binding cassette domain-containing protein [Geminicoccaceae bacterium]
MIEVDLTKTLGAFTLTARFTAPAAGVLGVQGASGAGKSTLLACLAGHLRPDRGRIALDGRVLFDAARRIDTAPARRGVGLVFQDGLLFPHMSVRQNLLYAVRGRPPADLARLLDLLGIEGLLARRPAHLSGGERQRVAIGRALVARPRLLLLDEPLGAVDPARKVQVLDLLQAVQRETHTPFIYVAHGQAELRRIADRLVRLDAGHVIASSSICPWGEGGASMAAFSQ